jgi:hypothetical protein
LVESGAAIDDSPDIGNARTDPVVAGHGDREFGLECDELRRHALGDGVHLLERGAEA